MVFFPRGRLRTAIVALAAALPLVGCGSMRSSCHEPGAYASAESIPPLKIPVGLQTPDTSNALRVPELNEPAPPPRKRGDACLDEPPSYSIGQTGQQS